MPPERCHFSLFFFLFPFGVVHVSAPVMGQNITIIPYQLIDLMGFTVSGSGDAVERRCQNSDSMPLTFSKPTYAEATA